MPRRTPLTRPRILAAAVDLINADGDVSMRALATRLSVTPMALYKHYPNKDALLLDVVEEISRDLSLPAEEHDPVADSAAVARGLHDFLAGHPWMVRLIATGQLASPRGFDVSDRLIRAARQAGLDDAAAFTFYRTMFATVLGQVTITATRTEREAAGTGDTGGTGGTAVQHVADRAADAVPAGLADSWADLDRATGPDEVFATVAAVLGAPPQSWRP
ncbi:MAG: TetR/AcrR family transcriptional regulator [Corynebacterium nuruki]|jgi:AcrR family transcriptional regulator|nr:TetR/AcrR family transcriptional regulator [Corynebacterium nuruki]